MPSPINLPPDPTIFSGKTVGDVVSATLPYIYVFSGLGLLMMLILGGIELMTAAGDPKKIESGYGRIKTGVIGFFIVFLSYMVVKVVEVVLGIKVF